MSLLQSENTTRVLENARQDARRLGHDHLGTEHVLLVLADEPASQVNLILERLGISPQRLRLETGKFLTPLPESCDSRRVTQTPGLARALASAHEEAVGFQADAVHPEHLLLGLLRETESVAAGVLERLGVTVDAVRRSLTELSGVPFQDSRIQSNSSVASAPLPIPGIVSRSERPVSRQATLLARSDTTSVLRSLRREVLGQLILIAGLAGAVAGCVLSHVGMLDEMALACLAFFGLGVLTGVTWVVLQAAWNPVATGDPVAMHQTLWEWQIVMAGLIGSVWAALWREWFPPLQPLPFWLIILVGYMAGRCVSRSGNRWLGALTGGLCGVILFVSRDPLGLGVHIEHDLMGMFATEVGLNILAVAVVSILTGAVVGLYCTRWRKPLEHSINVPLLVAEKTPDSASLSEPVRTDIRKAPR
jgi:ATP-dependent Clp protease ATP-binding subunit ClpC